ncbi:tetratricopeptide repeat protein [Butyrivibrio sp. YAB3001]|uniref:tetratricopeptide repeat protein n=1 Tax=Butyrivibrio sp. YAB3001 TaxID=1520812 RepID=UPI0008F68BE6|nr:tetratricopeptide repeat protein [Butyrivibrio sp. YAB3001]SFB73232.1 Tetratricopeptide repeat-containing protein [Butyrivibrio sp. YAB3001]
MEIMEKSKWYERKNFRILAGVLAGVLIITTVGYSLLRARAQDLYPDIESSDEALKQKSQENAGEYNLAEENSILDEYADLRKDINAGDYESAIEKTNTLLSSIDDAAVKEQFHELLSELYYNVGRYQESLDEADICLGSSEEVSGALYYVRGLSNLQLEEYTAAASDFISADKFGFEDKLGISLQTAIASFSGKDYENGAKYAENYLGYLGDLKTVVNAEDGENLSNENLCRYIAALSYLHLEDYKASIDHLDEILENGDDSELLYYRGINKMALEQYAQAAADFKKADEQGKKDTDLYYDLGVCQISNGEIDEGIENLKIVINKNDKPELSTAATNIITAIAQGN